MISLAECLLLETMFWCGLNLSLGQECCSLPMLILRVITAVFLLVSSQAITAGLLCTVGPLTGQCAVHLVLPGVVFGGGELWLQGDLGEPLATEEVRHLCVNFPVNSPVLVCHMSS